jgi:hypothetical protein
MSTFREELDSLIQRHDPKGRALSDQEALDFLAVDGKPTETHVIYDLMLVVWLRHSLSEFDEHQARTHTDEYRKLIRDQYSDNPKSEFSPEAEAFRQVLRDRISKRSTNSG